MKMNFSEYIQIRYTKCKIYVLLYKTNSQRDKTTKESSEEEEEDDDEKTSYRIFLVVCVSGDSPKLVI